MRPAPCVIVAACLAVVSACSGDNGGPSPKVPRPADPAGGKAAPRAPAPAGTAHLSEDMVAPLWTTSDELEGAAKWAAREYAAARDAFARAREATKDDDRAARLDLVLGLCHAKLDDATAAAQHLVAARPKLPLLADYVGYHAARALWLAKQPAEAEELVRQVARDSIVGPDAEILLGDLLRGKRDHTATAAHYRDYLTRRPKGPFRSEARYHLAEALEAGGGDPAEAVALYRRITVDDPLSSWTTKAKARLAALKIAESYTAAEHLARGMVLFDNMRNPESEAAFAAALADKAISAADKCVAAYHMAQSRFKARDRTGAAPMFDAAAAACQAAANTDLHVKSAYQAGRSYAFIGQHQTAIERYRAAQTIDPKHSYADDALLREGEEWTSLNDGAKVEETLAALPVRFPEGDMIAEAMWRLGWRAWREQRVDDAIKWWREQIRLVPHDDNYYGEGQAQYWLGRAYAAKQQLPEAIASWQAAVRQYPAAYYALMSLNRLRELAPKEYAQLVTEIGSDPPGYDPNAPAFTFKPRAEWAAPGFVRAMELLRLGLGDPAEQELKKLGLTAPGNKKRVDDPDQIEKLWAMAFLYDRARRHATSHWPTRWHILDYRKHWPVGANRARWLIAYPLAYQELLARHAKLNNVPFAMQIGIVREESAFNPLTESYANAIGLTQMIPPTAKDYSKGTGIDPTRENLRDPEKNVTIGSRFLGSLFKRWNNFALLVPTSYNAGPGAVRRMLRARGQLASDEFVEAIADDQARNYTKRVLGTYFTYAWLYDKSIPELPNAIPKDLIPKGSRARARVSRRGSACDGLLLGRGIKPTAVRGAGVRLATLRPAGGDLP
jgi:soluble lytic murein transglycosylase